FLYPWRSRDRQRIAPFTLVIRMQQKPDETSEVVAVQVGDVDVADSIGIDPEPAQADHGRGAAIDQEAALAGIDVKARLQPPARSERISAADNRQPHG